MINDAGLVGGTRPSAPRVSSQSIEIFRSVDIKQALRYYDRRLLKYATLLENSLAASLGKSVNIADRLSWYSFDVMGDLTFGQSFGGLEDQHTHWAITSIRDSNKALGLLGPVPWLIHTMTKLPNFLNPMYKLLLFSEQSVEKRRRMDPSEPDIMSYLLDGDKFFDDPALEYQLFTGDARLLIIGGSDTTATALSFLFYYLAADASLQQSAVEELRAQGLTSSEDIDVQAVQDMPYLNALINETLRLHPPVPSAPVRDTPPEGLQIGQMSIPGDVTVYTPFHSIQRSPEAFGQPDSFIPERWTSRPELISNKKAFTPFSIGPFSCIGRQLAYSEMRTAVSKLLLRFSFTLAPGETGDQLLNHSLDNFTMTIRPLNVLVKARESKSGEHS
jgi:cytochrome P450 family 628